MDILGYRMGSMNETLGENDKTTADSSLRVKRMTVKERITALRARMKETGIDAYLIPTDDFHGSEYVGEYFKCRKYITGFTGSAGTAVIMQDMAGLWTDGRYFIQAADQLEGTGITLFKMGEPEVPTVHEFLKKI